MTVIEMAREATKNEPIYGRQEFTFTANQLERFAELVRADEREACAKIVEESSLPDSYSEECLPEIADAIRARSNT